MRQPVGTYLGFRQMLLSVSFCGLGCRQDNLNTPFFCCPLMQVVFSSAQAISSFLSPAQALLIQQTVSHSPCAKRKRESKAGDRLTVLHQLRWSEGRTLWRLTLFLSLFHTEPWLWFGHFKYWGWFLFYVSELRVIFSLVPLCLLLGATEKLLWPTAL